LKSKEKVLYVHHRNTKTKENTLSKISYTELAEMLTYEPDTGRVFWKEGILGNRYSGKEASYLHDKNIGRYKVKHKNKRYFRSRLAWIIYYGEEPDGVIDHINGDQADDRIVNLRDVSHVENSLNCKKSKRNKTGYTGVAKNRHGTYTASYRSKYLGSFPSLDDAIEARKKAESECPYITERHGK